MLSILLLIAGLILLLAVPTLFAGASTVGVILTVAGGVLLAIQLIMLALVASKV